MVSYISLYIPAFSLQSYCIEIVMFFYHEDFYKYMYCTWYNVHVHVWWWTQHVFVSHGAVHGVDVTNVSAVNCFTITAPLCLHFLEDGKPKYTCEICGKSYIRSWSYYGHMREHASGEKQHKCDVCGKIFNYASNLRQHMLIHTGTIITCVILLSFGQFIRNLVWQILQINIIIVHNMQ